MSLPWHLVDFFANSNAKRARYFLSLHASFDNVLRVSKAQLGTLFFVIHLLNAASHLGAAWLAKRIGLLKTMVPNLRVG